VDEAEVEVSDKGRVDGAVDRPKVEDEVIGAEAALGSMR